MVEDGRTTPRLAPPSPSPVWWPADRPDLVSEVVSTLGLAGSVQVRAEASGPWGVHWDAGRPAMFHLMELGDGWISVPGEAPVHLSQGDVVLLKPGVAHDVLGSRHGRARHSASPSVRPRARQVAYHFGRGQPRAILICGAFHFASKIDHPLLTLLPAMLHVPAGTASDFEALAALLRELATEAAAGRPGSDLIVRRLTDILFVQLLRAGLQLEPPAPGGWLAAASDPGVGPALRAIHEDPRQPWTVAELARQAALSRSAFAARFANMVGEPPMQYLARWRVLLATRALSESTATVESIGQRVGYQSKHAFIRAFRRMIGTSPTAYRRSIGRTNQPSAVWSAVSSPAV
jgi:AraC-like DNA-binding protein